MTVLTRLAADTSVRAVLITGAGRAFCAGQDLHERRRAPGEPRADLGQSLRQGYNPIARAIRSLDKPVVCAVNGVAAGAGANLALACDLVVAKRSARFIQSFINIGLIPDCGGTWSLARKIGHARATGLAMTGTPIGAEQAVEWGLIWQCYPDESFGRDALQLGLELARKPTGALAAIKSALAGALPQHLRRTAGAGGRIPATLWPVGRLSGRAAGLLRQACPGLPGPLSRTGPPVSRAGT